MINVTIKKSFLVLILKKVFESIEMIANLVSMRVRKSKEKKIFEKKNKKGNDRSPTIQTFKLQIFAKLIKRIDLFRCSNQSSKKWIQFLFTVISTLEFFGSVCQIDHTITVSNKDLLDEKQKRMCFICNNMTPMLPKHKASIGVVRTFFRSLTQI